jgi:hypothetical protein
MAYQPRASPDGKIHDNRIYFNHSRYGKGITIAGELATDTAATMANPVDLKDHPGISKQPDRGNMAEDDGGGLRFLMVGDFPVNVYNNIIDNNVSMHDGGGVSLDDASNVRFFNNTVMKNITTATAVTSDGQPLPAGLSTAQNSVQLQVTLPGGSPIFSDPLLFNDIFWDNRAGTRGTNMVTGIGAQGDVLPIYNWDLGTADGSGTLSPTFSIIQAGDGGPAGSDPLVLAPYDIGLSFTSWRTNINFIGAIMVTADLPPNLLMDYHLTGASVSAIDAGTDSESGVSAPAFDIDNQTRPSGPGFDIGADEAQ